MKLRAYWTSFRVPSLQRGLVMLLGFAGAFMLIALRRPDILTHPQPWAEDGAVWMAQMQTQGFIGSIVLPQNGYFQTISKLTYGIALLFGLVQAALVANVIAVAVRAALVVFLLSPRLACAPWRYRAVAAAYLLTAPNLAEGYVNITNAHWYTAIYLMLVVLADPPRSMAGRWHDLAVLVVAGLSGPFIIFIAPCWLLRRTHELGHLRAALLRPGAFGVTLWVCVALQVAAILASSGETRSAAPLGASWTTLAQIVSNRIVLGSVVQDAGSRWYLPLAVHLGLALTLVTTVTLAAWHGGWRYRATALFTALVLAAALARPMVNMTEPQWPLLAMSATGERYFFITNFAWCCHVLHLVSRLGRAAPWVLGALGAAWVPAALAVFSIDPLPDVGYPAQIEAFDRAPPGTRAAIDIAPPGWQMVLVR